jgi:high-affinity nickel-transport protein
VSSGWPHRLRAAFTPGEWRRLGGLALAVAGLHVLGWGLILLYAPGHPLLAGGAWLAYTLGLRHAFDVDHIAAIDNTTRKLLQEGRRPLGIGFSFSLGHATIVFALSLGVALAAAAVQSNMAAFADVGGLVGPSVSGLFLCVVGAINLAVLAGMVRSARELRRGTADEAEVERRLADRGLIARLPLARRLDPVHRTWHMYLLGVLFGLGFDTATEVALLALTGTAATGGLSLPGILALPTLFAAGMTLCDTGNGIMMSRAYGWAFDRPARKLAYNITVTSLSVAVALTIGAIELVQVASERLHLDGGLVRWIAELDTTSVGYVLVAAFALLWTTGMLAWRALPGRA